MIVNESGSLTETGVVMLTVLALPAAVMAVPVLATLRRALGVAWPRAWRYSLAEVAIVYGTVPGVLLTLLPGNNGILSGNVSLVPLEDMSTMGPVGLIGNLLIFAALGFFGPIRFPALRSVWRVLILAGTASASIEALQHLLPIGRVSSVDDIILNAGGAALASILSWPWWRRRHTRRVASEQRRGDLVEAGSA
ncbi:glycopeptide antibiotics resistance protein [Nocardioides albertanoniae]|uniref:Glycopeptide antibiotics resistance protein n=1 Tax=Nocardioides albertanoniae TaxID=1175486 RepID=A0A543A8V8_9ACTN|nr:VanZ family protein [Nocardioides albertanoniae]TQL69038.1 glycopeptide antibiotics resistance protein [Nocardioides albertanoniae]